MNQSAKTLITEIAGILFLSAIIGMAWNHELLLHAWTGTAAAPAALAGPAAPVTTIPLPVGLMQVKEFFDTKGAIIVDARDAATFGQGRISGALSLPVGEFADKLPEFKAKAPVNGMIIAYCNGYGCHDSMELGKKLIAAGFRSVFVFEGGYPEWKDAGYPVEGSSP